MDIYRCFVFDCNFSSLRDFEEPKNKALDKRLSIKCIPPIRLLHQVERHQGKDDTKIVNIREWSK